MTKTEASCILSENLKPRSYVSLLREGLSHLHTWGWPVTHSVTGLCLHSVGIKGKQCRGQWTFAFLGVDFSSFPTTSLKKQNKTKQSKKPKGGGGDREIVF